MKSKMKILTNIKKKLQKTFSLLDALMSDYKLKFYYFKI